MALKLSELVKKSIEKGYGSFNHNVEKPWTQSNLFNKKEKNQQAINNPESIIQSDNESSNKVVTKSKQSDNESNNKVVTKLYLNEGDNKNKCNNKAYLNLQSLSGVQLVIFNKMLSIKNKVNKEYYIQVNTAKLAAEIGINVNVLRVSIGRIVNKQILVRESGFMGRNGASIFKVPAHILKYKDEINQENKNLSEYNNNNINIITNNKSYLKKDSQNSLEINNWWNNLNLLPLEEYGFKHAQFKQLDGLNEFEVVQESLNHFAWGLKNNPNNEKYKDNPSRVLLSILKKGGAWIEDGYKDPQELAMEKLIQSRKKSAERKKKLEEEIYSLALNEWIDTLNKDDIEKIAPKKIGNDLMPQKSRLSKYFKEKIWSEKKGEYSFIQ